MCRGQDKVEERRSARFLGGCLQMSCHRLPPREGAYLVTIIIVNWNGGEALLRCLDSIRASRSSFFAKVIIVDNDSRDGSRELAMAEFPEFLVLNTGANLGFGRGNNFARRYTETPLVLFLNPDTELFPDTLEKAVRSLLSRQRVGILGCQARHVDGSIRELGLQWFPTPERAFLELVAGKLLWRKPIARLLPWQDPRRSGPVRKLYGGFMLCRRETLEAAGWFDERYFMYAEDVDLSRTVRERGWELYYDADCTIVHRGGATSDKAPSGFSVLMQLRSTNQMIEKYQGRQAARRHRWAVGLAAAFRLSALGIARLPQRAWNASRRVPWESAWQRSLLLWQWAWHGREAPIPAYPTEQPASTATRSVSAIEKV